MRPPTGANQLSFPFRLSISDQRIERSRLDPVLKDHGHRVVAVVADLLDQDMTVFVLARILTGRSDLIECLANGDANVNQRRPHASDKRLWVALETFGHWGGLWIVDCGRVWGWRAMHAVSLGHWIRVLRGSG